MLRGVVETADKFRRDRACIIDDHRRGIADFMRSLFAGLAAFVEKAKSRGEVEPDVPSGLLVRNLFAIYFQHMQVWLSGRVPDLDMRRLHDALELQLRGLGAPASRRRAPRRRRVAAGAGRRRRIAGV